MLRATEARTDINQRKRFLSHTYCAAEVAASFDPFVVSPHTKTTPDSRTYTISAQPVSFLRLLARCYDLADTALPATRAVSQLLTASPAPREGRTPREAASAEPRFDPDSLSWSGSDGGRGGVVEKDRHFVGVASAFRPAKTRRKRWQTIDLNNRHATNSTSQLPDAALTETSEPREGRRCH